MFSSAMIVFNTIMAPADREILLRSPNADTGYTAMEEKKGK